MSLRLLLASLFLAPALIVPARAIDGPFRITDLGDGFWVFWFEAEHYDSRDPDTDQYYPVVADLEAYGGFAINRAGGAGGVIRYSFDISEIGGTAGTAYFWGRVVNPGNQSDFMLVEGDPGDPDIPAGPPPYPGGGVAPFDVPDDRIFEEDTGPPYGWARVNRAEGHTKELRDGVNTMHIFHRSGNATVFWDVFAWTNDPAYLPTDIDYENAEEVEEATCDGADTHCLGFTVIDPDGLEAPNPTSTAGIYTVNVDVDDDAGDPVTVAVTAQNDAGLIRTETGVGTGTVPVLLRLGEGVWNMTVSVDDSPFCDDLAEDATCRDLEFDVAPAPACSLLNDGVITGALIIGPIDIQAPPGAQCDDSGRLATTDYLTDGEVDETNVLPSLGDTMSPDFGGLAGGIGVKFSPNPDLNPGAFDGELEIWRADADFEQRLLDFDAIELIGPSQDYVVYCAVYLENTTEDCIDALLEVGTADSFKLLVNGGVAAVRTVCRDIPAFGAGDMVPVSLAPGTNIVLAAVVQAGGRSAVRLVLRNPDETPLDDGSVVATCQPPASYPGTRVVRTIEPATHSFGDAIDVTLVATGGAGRTTIVETIPDGYRIDDVGVGEQLGNQIIFDVSGDAEVGYRLVDDDCACRVTILGEAQNGAVCTQVRGDSELVCDAGLPRITVSNFLGGSQIWIQAEDWTGRDPDTDDFFASVCVDGAFGRAATLLNRNGGRLSHSFDISEAGGVGGTWYFWGRVINPENRSDYMLVENDPDDAEIPQVAPYPGGNESPPLTNIDDQIFEETIGPDWGWSNDDQAGGHTKTLQDGVNTMHFFRREGRQAVLWDVFMWANDPTYIPSDEDFLASTPPGVGPVGVPFVRGDANNDRAANISDAQYILNFLFLGGPGLECQAAGDANSDGGTNISDAQFILNFLFLGGPAIAAPNLCGEAPLANRQDCATSSCEGA